MASSIYFVQNLTLRAWWFSIFPRMARAQFSREDGIVGCYVINSSKLALAIAKLTGLITGVTVNRFVYSLVDVRDDDGLQIRIKIEAQDLQSIQDDIVATPEFVEAFTENTSNNCLELYVAKMAIIDGTGPQAVIWQALITLQACAWKSKRAADANSACTVFIENRIWTEEIRIYAQRLGLTTVPISPGINAKSAIIKGIPPQIRRFLRSFKYRSLRKDILAAANVATGEPLKDPVEHKEPYNKYNRPHKAIPFGPKVSVDYYGQLNLSRPELSSELFFWQQSCLNGSDILLNLRFPFVPLSVESWQQLHDNGISSIAMHPGATGGFDIPVFDPDRTPKQDFPTIKYRKAKSRNAKWIAKQINSYELERSIWTEFFARNGVKIYTTWYRNGPSHCAITDALESLGGVTAIYQRSYEDYPTPLTTTASDIAFDFSKSAVDMGNESGSRIKYHIITGFLGDHRFATLRYSELEIRNKLKANGAQWIAAYFDENTVDDPRWFTGHKSTQENYAFLLEKVLSNTKFGLVIKPRTPQGLRRRLGPVDQILEAAIKTGRCYIYENGGIRGTHTPAAAALASDIAIHGHLYAGSAGMESALAGVPTLLLDREGWHKSPLYKLGVGKVVFTDWESLWEAVENLRSDADAHPYLGDWSPMLDELDPFRDGRAAERMGVFIHWLLQGFTSGLDRETVMANSAERYCAAWGTDKVFEPLTRTTTQNRNSNI